MKPFFIRLIRLTLLVTVVPVCYLGWFCSIILFPLIAIIDMVWHGITYLIYGKSSKAVQNWYEWVTDSGMDWSTETLPRLILGKRDDV